MVYGRFYTGVLSHCHQQLVYKLSVVLNIPIIGRLITIWDEVLFKLMVYFDGLVIRNNFFSEVSHRIETHIDAVVEVL